MADDSMTPAARWQVLLRTTTEAEEVVSALMQGIFGSPPVAVSRPGSEEVELSVYCQRRTQCGPARLTALRKGIARMRSRGSAVGVGRVRVKAVAPDWAESWKRHFQPLLIGGALHVRPSWRRARIRPGQVEVVLDPGLSFGTGHHATTGFCLEQIVGCGANADRQSFLDVGTGSGILALAAAKLGYRPVHAFDADASAIRIARENARLNGVGRRVRFWRSDVLARPEHGLESYDLVCANLQTDLLISACANVASRVRDGGRLVLAGILTREFVEVTRRYRTLGFAVVGRKEEKEWTSGAFVRR